ncbi:MAG: hypothetical protein AAB821_02600 [Patescibacteria group bacterium]
MSLTQEKDIEIRQIKTRGAHVWRASGLSVALPQLALEEATQYSHNFSTGQFFNLPLHPRW